MAEVQVSSLPTQLQLAIGIPGQQRMVLLRTEPRPVDLDRIVRLDAVAREVKASRIGPREASVRIDAIGRSPPPYSPPMVLFAYCLAAAGAVLLFGEDAPEAVTAAVAGLAVGGVAVVRGRVRELDLTAELVSAFLAGFICQTASARVWPLDPRVATLGAVVVLLPASPSPRRCASCRRAICSPDSPAWARRRSASSPWSSARCSAARSGPGSSARPVCLRWASCPTGPSYSEPRRWAWRRWSCCGRPRARRRRWWARLCSRLG